MRRQSYHFVVQSVLYVTCFFIGTLLVYSQHFIEKI